MRTITATVIAVVLMCSAISAIAAAEEKGTVNVNTVAFTSADTWNTEASVLQMFGFDALEASMKSEVDMGNGIAMPKGLHLTVMGDGDTKIPTYKVKCCALDGYWYILQSQVDVGV